MWGAPGAPTNLDLVPKLYLGTPLAAKLRLQGGSQAQPGNQEEVNPFLSKAGRGKLKADRLRGFFMEDQYEPLIVAFCCNWCSYAGADLAGVSRLQYPPNGRIIRVMCSGMVHPTLVINALTKGADGVLVCG